LFCFWVWAGGEYADKQPAMRLEKVAVAIHCNLRPPDVVPIVHGFRYEVGDAQAYRFNTFLHYVTKLLFFLQKIGIDM